MVVGAITGFWVLEKIKVKECLRVWPSMLHRWDLVA